MRRRLIAGLFAAGLGLALLAAAIRTGQGQVSATSESCQGCYTIQYVGFDDSGCLQALVVFWNATDRVAVTGVCGTPSR